MDKPMPILLGKSSIYCVEAEDGGYTLPAYDFHGTLLNRHLEHLEESIMFHRYLPALSR
ncbi:hypothetical protein BJX64DRAFT_273146 [Aspergillus heterothallicus]